MIPVISATFVIIPHLAFFRFKLRRWAVALIATVSFFNGLVNPLLPLKASQLMKTSYGEETLWRTYREPRT